MKFFHNSSIHLFYILILLVSFVLIFSYVSPLYMVTPDDWTYIGYIREPLPLWGNWNPSKVFPETLFGIAGYISAFIVTPITGDYLFSITFTCSFIISVFICLYVWSFDVYISNLFKLSDSRTIFVSIFFIFLHFIVFKEQFSDGKIYKLTFLSSCNLNLDFNYLIPFLFCSSLSLLLLTCHSNSDGKFLDYSKLGLYSNISTRHLKSNLLSNRLYASFAVLFLYLAIFSNLVDNIILISTLLFTFVIDLLNKNKKISIANYWFYIVALFFEIICLVFEAKGGRADSLTVNYNTNLIEFFEDLKTVKRTLNYPFLRFSVYLIIISILLCSLLSFERVCKFMNFVNSNESKFYLSNIFTISFLMIVCSVYEFCLILRIGEHMILRTDYLVIFFFYYFVVVTISLAYIISKIKFIFAFMPLISFVLIISLFTGNYHYSFNGDDYDLVQNQNRDYIKQFKQSDSNNQSKIKLYVNKDTNIALWKEWAGDRISQTLYKHHVIRKPMKTEIILTDR